MSIRKKAITHPCTRFYSKMRLRRKMKNKECRLERHDNGMKDSPPTTKRTKIALPQQDRPFPKWCKGVRHSIDRSTLEPKRVTLRRPYGLSCRLAVLSLRRGTHAFSYASGRSENVLLPFISTTPKFVTWPISQPRSRLVGPRRRPQNLDGTLRAALMRQRNLPEWQ